MRAITPFGFCLALLGPAVLAAQTIEGRLLDDETGEPIPTALVTLLDEAGNALRSRLTDAEGGFSVPVPVPGRYRLRAERMGYEETALPPVDVRAGEILQVELRLAVDAIALAPLTVVSNRPALVLDTWLLQKGFYERREEFGKHGVNSGYFLERAEIERLNPFYVTDVLRMVPGVWGRPVRTESSSRYVTQLTMRRGCQPTIFLDGQKKPPGVPLDELISAWSIIAVEVYTSIPMPLRYRSVACGTIVLWSGPS